MISRLPSIGVVLAGGVGQRVGHTEPKQLIKLAGRTILEHTIALFDASDAIDEVVVLMTPGFVEPVRELVRRCGFGKVTAVVEGGESRTESTWRALRAVGERECNVLLHDAVRPLLEPRIIADCVRALETYEAVEVAIPSSDTVLVAEGDLVREVLDRSRLRRAQTPQAFRLSVIREAYRRAMADPDFATRQATDDCGVVLRYLPEVPIHLVPGSERNLKVTHPLDLSIAERLLRLAAASAPAPAPADYRRVLGGRTLAVFGDGARLAALAGGHGAAVRSFPAQLAGTEEQAAKALAEAGPVDHVVHLSVPVDGELAGARAEAVALACLGAANVARAAYPLLRESGGALVLLAGGGDGSVAAPARAATAELARVLAAEWAGHGVRVNAVLTGPSTGGQAARACLDALVSGLTGQVVET
ncbi:bifunctional cytidylyltransferase/SDR family oxidoreductase [Nonomuraea sp. MCN248]|uniref:2-C-methyl-D-erythritol 4-phosphate cytidylyltransferase n=1 Tax=Nonomuraea corallina TaxID=2989783 RepID=A0ABT4SEF2_9ACTN|nr:bifunctional cytidylyltransferase/SDR family oxidoreductase [Nonomuraea corallina]MDA0635355.1 bifunctional cytidylyltransferase/SDR family oxidoreductase [Nonomuraea corallina]